MFYVFEDMKKDFDDFCEFMEQMFEEKNEEDGEND